MSMLKGAVAVLIGLIVHLYTTFVLTVLWNWFVTMAFHVGQISFFVMYGLVLMVSMFQIAADNLVEEHRWKVLLLAVNECVPDNKRESLTEQLEYEKPDMWGEVSKNVMTGVFANTLTLGVAFVVHILAG